MATVRRRGVSRLLPRVGRTKVADGQPGQTPAPCEDAVSEATLAVALPAPPQAEADATGSTGSTEVLDEGDVDWEAIEVPWDTTSRRSPLAGRTEADLRAHVLQLEQRRRDEVAQEAAEREAAEREYREREVAADAGPGARRGWSEGMWLPGDADCAQPVPGLGPAPSSGPGAGHPLDEPGFDLEGLLSRTGDTDSPGWPCPHRDGDGLGHWVAARSGWHEIGLVDVDPDCAPGVADIAPPGLYAVWARCKSCFWPVFNLAFYTDPDGAQYGFYAELGVSDGDVLQTSWRLLTPARARAVGAEWPVPWHFATPHDITGVPW